MHDVNIPEIHAEVSAVFYRYEQALVNNDVAVLDELFHDNEHTLRFGVTENLFSYAEIAAFRASRPSVGLKRELIRTVITTYGRDFGVANTSFRREDADRTGRQSHTWLRTPQGWRIIAAHVSLLPPGAASSAN